MAGKPQRRIRQLREALSAQGIDPDALRTAAPSAQTPGLEDLPRVSAGARTHARAPGGPVTRSTIDQRTAADLTALAAQLAPGFCVRLERTRPTWAAGWVEDLPIDDHDLGAVLEYLRDEHGGQLYRATVLGTDGAELYTSRVPIAGPPRRRGRVLPRASWEGSDNDHAPTVAAQAAPQGLAIADLVQLVQAMQSTSGERQETVLEAVREMTNQTQTSTRELVRAVLETRSAERTQGGLQHQLREVVEATHAIEEIREALAVPDGGPRGEPANPMRTALGAAAAEVLAEGMRSEMRRQHRPHPPQSAQRPPTIIRRRQPPTADPAT